MPNVTNSWFVGRGKFKVDLERSETPPVDPGDGQTVEGASILWTIHPQRRVQAMTDTKRKRKRWGRARLSVNTDFRTWRKTLTYSTRRIVAVAIQTLCELWAGKTYAELEADSSTWTYADIPDSECTYADLEVM